MILRAQAVGEHPSVRFFILNVRNNLMWDGESFVDDFDQARKYWHPSDACADMQDILREHYGQLRRRRFVVPVEIEVYGSVSPKEIAEYLHRASILSIRSEEFGNGPAECLVLPIIHWGFIKELKLALNGKPDDPAVEWGLEDENENQ
ncbi:hypothetical protein [Novipirellula rosea]|uniref:Uncharacterized protein n=1 Tax=Novipirellula rosea TaxID=1031540 RepID=A0ABP8M6J1_9BACT